MEAPAQRPARDPQRPSFWAWSLDRYRRPGVESQLLRLQDECALNVNVLLWAMWCAEHFEATPELAFRKALDQVHRWQTQVTKPVREARRHLKSLSDVEGAEALRMQIKEAELAAEKIEQATLQKTADDLLTPAASLSFNDVQQRARRNLATYATLAKAPRRKGFSTSLLQSLIDLIFAEAAHKSGPSAHSRVHQNE